LFSQEELMCCHVSDGKQLSAGGNRSSPIVQAQLILAPIANMYTANALGTTTHRGVTSNNAYCRVGSANPAPSVPSPQG
jgi:hypothetical protein